MLRRRTMTKAFFLGVDELDQDLGAKKTAEIMEKVGKRLAQLEGPGLMGEQMDGIDYFPICLFAAKLGEFIEAYGNPEGHKEVQEYIDTKQEGTLSDIAAVNVCCEMCHAYRKERGLLAGKKDLLHLGAKSSVTGKKKFNEAAIKKAKYTKKQIDKMLDTYDCICKYI